jgi:hypothetical protein
VGVFGDDAIINLYRWIYNIISSYGVPHRAALGLSHKSSTGGAP